MHFLATLLAAATILAAIEGVAWWWMNSGSPKISQPVLIYHPPPASQPDEPTAEAPVITPLPEIYHHAAPMLRCTHGHVHHIGLGDGKGMHVAFFEWDGTDTGSVLEAFRHMPEACMGAIGLQLVSREPPILHTISPASGSGDSITLVFDHTIFREPRASANPLVPAPLVHAFRAVWVAGVDQADPRSGIRGRQFTDLRAIRLDAARSRFRPPHARVIQGAVRGIPNSELAWKAFQHHVLDNVEQHIPDVLDEP